MPSNRTSYIVIVARVEEGKVVWVRPGVSFDYIETSPQIQLETRLKILDSIPKEEIVSNAENLSDFYRRLVP